MTYEQLIVLLSEYKISISEFCKLSGISRQVLTNAKSRGGHFSATTLGKMKNFFESHGMWQYKDYLIDMNNIGINSDSNEKMNISFTAYELAKDFDLLSNERQRMIIEMIAFYKSKEQD